MPYLFNAKELDEETGLYYYGARYYDPRISLWLSTDPLQEKYPNISPYAYVANNPVNLIDPTGMDWVEDENGNVFWKAEYTKDNIPEGYKYIGTEYAIGDTKFTQITNKEGEVSLYASVVDKKSDQISTQETNFAPAIPWYTTAGEVVGTTALRISGVLLSLIFLTGDTEQDKLWLVSRDAYYPPPKELPGFPGAERVGRNGGRVRWKLPDGSIGEWDSQHGELEVYDKTGKKHKGAYDPKTGEKKKEGKSGRKTEK
jgi:RHS repeat-associated protein